MKSHNIPGNLAPKFKQICSAKLQRRRAMRLTMVFYRSRLI